MLRALLLACPVALVAVVSCGEAAEFKDGGGPGSAGNTSSTSGAATGGNSNTQAGSSNTAGKNGVSGSSNNTAGTTNQNQGGRGGTGGTAMSGAGAPAEPLAGAGPSSAGAPGNAGANAGGAGNVAPCPNVFGDYDIVDTQGNCGTLNKDAAQSIQGTAVACFAHFVSIVPNGNAGVNGGAALDQNGNFTGVKLFLDKTQRTCSGTWDAVEERMTLKCGGQAEQCTILLDLK